jgi:hypothetical protein
MQVEYERGGIPLLTRTNYNRWKRDMEAILDSRDCLTIVNGKEPKPVSGVNGHTPTDVRNWERSEAVARTIIGRALDEEHWTYVRGGTTATEWWTILKKTMEKKAETDAVTASQAFHAYSWQPGQNMTAFIAGIKVLWENLQDLNVQMAETTVVGKILQSLPPSYQPFKQSWKLLQPTNRTLENLQSALLEAETDIEETGNNMTDPGEAFLSKGKFQRKQGNWNSRKKTRTQDDQDSQDLKQKDKECWHCGKRGRLKADCRKRQSGKESKKEGRRSNLKKSICSRDLHTKGIRMDWRLRGLRSYNR